LMERNFKLVIEYDGTGYRGWQRQKSVPTVQGMIEAAIAKMTGKLVTLHGSGRTDAGVHARNQVANFLVDTELTSETFRKGLNSLTPEDIVIKDCQVVPESFHAQFDATSKVYQYVLLNSPTPAAISRQYAWHVRKPLDLRAVEIAMDALRGTHDFAAFEGVGSPRAHTVRTVMAAAILAQGRTGKLVFTIEADGFLRCMVRNIVGTLVDVGAGKTSPVQFSQILASRDRKRAGATAPPHGLFLMEVKY
jgi:tRNA pseudouridine38-40 synthase